MDTVPSATSVRFLSTPSARRATDADGDTLTVTEFLSTPSARRATRAAAPCRFPSPYFYPRPPRGGRPRPERGSRQRQRISIHALREEGDGRTSRRRSKPANFYPRPPRGGRLDRQSVAAQILGFLSTPSARRATDAPAPRPWLPMNFYPRPPRGGRPGLTNGERDALEISIHALREEGDQVSVIDHLSSSISIHALREEGDSSESCTPRVPPNFYPRPPRGGRPTAAQPWAAQHRFLSTPSARRATARRRRRCQILCISIHALREGGDLHLSL